MTKAEAVVYASELWEFDGSGTETYHGVPHTRVNIYIRKDHTYQLRCYSYFGDSILSRWDREYAEWVDMGNIEHRYEMLTEGGIA